jgi:mannose-6-phosphate isomerase
MKTDYLVYPLKLSYHAKETVWGGSKLSKIFGKSPSSSLGETWELSVRHNENNLITNGPCAGISLKEYIEKYTS